MSVSKDLLVEFVARYPAQPATAFFRAIEIDKLAEAMQDIEGLGLDLGCGDGILTDILFKRIGIVPDLVGVDPDPEEIAAAKNYPFYKRLHTVFGDNIPEADGTFDYVFSNSVLEHISDLEPVIAEASRVLKPGGTFFFTVPGPGFRENLHGSLVGQSREQYLTELDKRLAHFHYLSSRDWEQMCARNGLSLSATSGYIDSGEIKRWETLSRFTGGLLHSLSGGSLRPIEIQRTLKLREFQNRKRLPRPIASSVATLISSGIGKGGAGAQPSCLLVTGKREALREAA